MNNEDLFDADGRALQIAYETLQIVLKTDPGVYEDVINPVLNLIKQRLQSSWRDKPKKKRTK